MYHPIIGISNNNKTQIVSALKDSEKALAVDTALVEQLNLAVVAALVFIPLIVLKKKGTMDKKEEK